MKNRVRRTGIIASFLLIICLLIPVSGQETVISIQKEEISQVVDSAAKFMRDYYVFPDKGKEISDVLLDRLKKGKYDSFSDPQEFAGQLTEDLRSVNNDRHIGVSYAPESIRLYLDSQKDQDNNEFEKAELRNNQFQNFGFQELKILPGNIGYLDLEYFSGTKDAGPTAVAAMNFFAHTGALIIDLRTNGGGSPEMIQLLSSYLFEDVEHLNSFYVREGDKYNQFWTLPHVPGPKLIKTGIYILTSNRTFSAAEEFTYNLKNMERATIVGETTGGGAHPVERHLLNDNFSMSVPFGKAVNPVTGTNWEGTGIEPHVKVPADQALDKAKMMALENLLKTEKEERYKNLYEWQLEGLKAKLKPVTISSKLMETYSGVYGPRKISIQDGQLFYQRETNPKMRMIPMTEDYFRFEEIDYFRLKIIIEDGKAVAVEGHYDNGDIDKNERSK